MIDWPYVGSEQAHTKYSAGDAIAFGYVDELKIVWHWEPSEMPLKAYGTRPGPLKSAVRRNCDGLRVQAAIIAFERPQ